MRTTPLLEAIDGNAEAAFPSAVAQQKLENVVRELRRHREAKERGGGLSIEDRALHFRVERIVSG